MRMKNGDQNIIHKTFKNFNDIFTITQMYPKVRRKDEMVSKIFFNANFNAKMNSQSVFSKRKAHLKMHMYFQISTSLPKTIFQFAVLNSFWKKIKLMHAPSG